VQQIGALLCAGGVSKDVYQQPLLLRVRFEGTFLRVRKNIFKFLKIRTAFNSLHEHNLLIVFDIIYENSSPAMAAAACFAFCNALRCNALQMEKWYGVSG
jgi:hypothetical protein